MMIGRLNLCDLHIQFISLGAPLNVSILVCKHWYRVLIIDGAADINADLPKMNIEKVIELPAFFYKDLDLKQKIQLPNTLFYDDTIGYSLRRYSTYKYKLPWEQILQSTTLRNLVKSDYLHTLFMASPDSLYVYFRALFTTMIQYRHYILEFAEIAEFVRGSDDPIMTKTNSKADLTNFSVYIWSVIKFKSNAVYNLIANEFDTFQPEIFNGRYYLNRYNFQANLQEAQ